MYHLEYGLGVGVDRAQGRKGDAEHSVWSPFGVEKVEPHMVFARCRDAAPCVYSVAHQGCTVMVVMPTKSDVTVMEMFAVHPPCASVHVTTRRNSELRSTRTSCAKRAAINVLTLLRRYGRAFLMGDGFR